MKENFIMKKIGSIFVVLIILGFVGYRLWDNKQEIDEKLAFAGKEISEVPVRLKKVGIEQLDTYFDAAGLLSSANDVMLIPMTQGQVVQIFKSTGEKVKKGEVIMKVDDSLILAELKVTEANLEKAKRDLDRAKRLADGDAITSQQLEGLQLNEKAAAAKLTVSKKRYEDTSVKATISGVINQVFAKEGGMIGPSVPVCEIVDTEHIELAVDVTAFAAVRLRKGMPADVRVEILPGHIFGAQIRSVAVKAGFSNRYKVILLLEPVENASLKAGMFARVRFHFPDKTPGPVIPANAVVSSMKNPVIYIVADGMAKSRHIEIEYVFDDKIKVLKGVKTGEEVVVSGQFNLSDGMTVHRIE